MPNEPIPRDDAIRAATSLPDGGGEGSDQPSGKAAVDPGDADQNAAEQLRRGAEQAREIGERHRTAAEVHRQEHEQLREGAEIRRALSEQARVAADAARDEVVESVRATV